MEGTYSLFTCFILTIKIFIPPLSKGPLASLLFGNYRGTIGRQREGNPSNEVDGKVTRSAYMITRREQSAKKMNLPSALEKRKAAAVVRVQARLLYSDLEGVGWASHSSPRRSVPSLHPTNIKGPPRSSFVPPLLSAHIIRQTLPYPLLSSAPACYAPLMYSEPSRDDTGDVYVCYVLRPRKLHSADSAADNLGCCFSRCQ